LASWYKNYVESRCRPSKCSVPGTLRIFGELVQGTLRIFGGPQRLSKYCSFCTSSPKMRSVPADCFLEYSWFLKKWIGNKDVFRRLRGKCH
jgi:hypothetical protein